MKSWLRRFFHRKWTWAGHVARMGAHRWLKKVTVWEDMGLRARPGRWRRWEEDVRKFCSDRSPVPWVTLAQNRDAWKAWEKDFAGD